jgi:hypothetical protein
MNQSHPYYYGSRYRLHPLMGALTGVNAGDLFAIAFNTSLTLFGPSPEDIPGRLAQMNLAYEVLGEQTAGVITPWINVTGRAMGNWATPSSFRDALLSAIESLGFEIDRASVSYRIVPRAGSTQPTPAPSPTPRPAPRPSTPTPDEEEGEWFPAVAPLPSSFYETPSTQPPAPPKDDKGVNTTWLLLGFGLLAIVLASRD